MKTIEITNREKMQEIAEDFELNFDDTILSFRVRMEGKEFVISREKQNSSVDVYEGIDEIGYFEELAATLK